MLRLAEVKRTLARLAPVKSAPLRLAWPKTRPVRSAEEKSWPERLMPEMLAAMNRSRLATGDRANLVYLPGGVVGGG